MKSFNHIHQEFINGFIAAQAKEFRGKSIEYIKHELEGYDKWKKILLITNIVFFIVGIGLLAGTITCTLRYGDWDSKTLTWGMCFVSWLVLWFGFYVGASNEVSTGCRLLWSYERLNTTLALHNLPQLDQAYKVVRPGIETRLSELAVEDIALDHAETGDEILQKAQIKESLHGLYDQAKAFTLVAADPGYYYGAEGHEILLRASLGLDERS